MTSAVVHNGSSSLEFDSNGVQIQGKENEPVSEYPAVIVEPVPCARVEQGYAAQIFVYDDETYLLQDVAEEQEIETETVKTEILPVAQIKFSFNFKILLPQGGRRP
uniref:Transcription factor Elf N-terminal domain-containing protein n=4 Tax=Micrurus TaxID=8634 RepID=A0A2D4LG65_9SAUR